MKIIIKPEIISIFNEIQNKLKTEDVYLVGGFVRDFFFNRESLDLDFATSASPEVLKKSFPYALSFYQYGSFSFKQGDYHITITSFRKESMYDDYRHPKRVEFIKDFKEDYKRRDFTINAMYLSLDGEILDPSGKSIQDSQEKILRFIGDPFTRINEDPLRILRAFRLKEKLDLKFEESSQTALFHSMPLLHRLNPDKIKEELRKCPEHVRYKLINELELDFIYNNRDGGSKK